MGREQLHPALAWIADKDGIPRGAGVLVAPRQVLTCAHVVAAALGILSGQAEAAPEDPVGVRFTHISDFRACQARVRAARWFPPGTTGGAGAGRGDLALLDLLDNPPAGAHPVPSFASGVGPPHSIHAYGLPTGHGQVSGGWASGTLSGTQASGWIQIDGSPEGYRIQPGFSGAAAWSDEAEAVVGLIVAAEVSADTRVGWMIPASVIAQHCPEIALVPLRRDSSLPPLHEMPPPTAKPGSKGAAVNPRVVKVINAPPPPDDVSKDGGINDKIMMPWIQEWFRSAKIIVNMGAEDGVTEGDYFDALAKHDPIDEDGVLIGYVDAPGSLIRAVQVQPQLSVCTLENWGYANFFKYVLPGRLEKRGLADTETLQPADYALLAPIAQDDPVARIPSEEKDARDEVEDLYGRSLEDDIDAQEKQRIYRDMIRRADRFLMRFPRGYFSGPMLYHKGYAQIKLNDYEDAIDTFDMYRRRYPFDSTDGADRYIREAKEALKQQASLRSDVALVTSARPTPQTWRQPDSGMMSLIVSYDPAENTYRFQFSGPDHAEAVATRVTPDLRQRVERLIRDVGDLARGVTGYSATETRSFLVNIGAQLWSELIPQQLHEQFWDRQQEIRQLTIISDDDVIPWELLYPMDPGHDTGFLVEQFTVTRGIPGSKLARRLHLQPARFVISDPGQQNFQEEVDALRQILDPAQPQDAVVSGLTPLLELINRGGFGVLHFSCYNQYNLQDGVSIKLDKRFTPDNMATAAIMQPLADSAPLVFINSSRSVGWARAFLRAGAGAFIGTLWPIRSTAAAGFAVDLYEQLLEGAPLGEAMARARRTIAANEADDPSSFAYTLYGDAQARAVSSKDQPGEDVTSGPGGEQLR